MIRLSTRLILTALVLALAVPTLVAAQQPETPTAAQLSPADSGSELASRLEALPSPIVNGVLDHGSPSVGLVLNAGAVCTGTLVGCQTFLTAAHCVCNEGDNALTGAQCQNRPDLLEPTDKAVFFQHAPPAAVSEVIVHPDYVFGEGSDLAVLRLAQPVAGIRPSRINQGGRPAFESVGAIVGFGDTLGQAGDAGLKRSGLVKSAPCLIASDSRHVCWDFVAPIGDPGFDSSTCQGDSGGPLFMDFGSGFRIVGVTSGGIPDCLAPNNPWTADVFVDRAWIQSVAGADLHTTNCGTIPFAGEPETSILGGADTLSSANSQVSFSLEVPPNIGLLGVTLNGTFSLDADLFIRRGSPPTTNAFDCSSTLPLSLESCGLADPQSGTWYILADRFQGQGPFQVTATLFEENAGNGNTSPCVEDEFTLCAVSDRFEITATAPRSRYDGLAGRVSPVIEGDLGGAFHYFRAEKNFHTVVKIGLRPSGYYAVSSVALDPLEWTVRVRDTLTGEVKTYHNPQGGLGYGTDVKAFKKDP